MMSFKLFGCELTEDGYQPKHVAVRSGEGYISIHIYVYMCIYVYVCIYFIYTYWSGNLNFLEPSGPLQACNRIDLPLYIHIHIYIYIGIIYAFVGTKSL